MKVMRPTSQAADGLTCAAKGRATFAVDRPTPGGNLSICVCKVNSNLANHLPLLSSSRELLQDMRLEIARKAIFFAQALVPVVALLSAGIVAEISQNVRIFACVAHILFGAHIRLSPSRRKASANEKMVFHAQTKNRFVHEPEAHG